MRDEREEGTEKHEVAEGSQDMRWAHPPQTVKDE